MERMVIRKAHDLAHEDGVFTPRRLVEAAEIA